MNQLQDGLNTLNKSTKSQFKAVELEMQALRKQVENLVEVEMQVMHRQVEAVTHQLSSLTLELQRKNNPQFEDSSSSQMESR